MIFVSNNKKNKLNSNGGINERQGVAEMRHVMAVALFLAAAFLLLVWLIPATTHW